MIPAKNYQARRTELAKRAEQPLIVISGSDLIQKSSDETYDFEQDGYFYYLTGIEEPGWVLVIDVHRGSEFLISTDESSYHSPVWDVKYSNEEITLISGVREIKNRKDGWHYLNHDIQNYQSVGSLVPKMRFSRPFGMYLNPAKSMLVERLKRAHKDANLVDISGHIRQMRSVKEPAEIELIKQAIAVTKTGFDKLYANLGGYQNESQIYADLSDVFMRHDSNFGYTPVIASGKNATKLHYKANNRQIEQDNFLLLDVGARVQRYSADVTRSLPIGTLSQRHQDVFNAVREAQADSFEFLGPGVSMRDHEMYIEQVIGHALNSLGVIKTMLRQDIRRYFPHAISHHLGIDLHDSCDYELPLQPGAVITVEPGIYLPEEGIGVRIEEDVLITETGTKVLTEQIGTLA